MTDKSVQILVICKNCGHISEYKPAKGKPQDINRIECSCPSCGATRSGWRAAVNRMAVSDYSAYKALPVVTASPSCLFDGTMYGRPIEELATVFATRPLKLL